LKVKRTINTAVLDKLQSQIKNASAKVGFLGGMHEDGKTPVAYIASVHEFGVASKGIPPRPFMRPTVAEQKQEWASIAERGALAIARGNATTIDVLEAIAQTAAGDVRKTISKIQSPALSENTIKARQRKMANGKKVGNLTKPLVETGLLLASVSHEVKSDT
jgi:hypothetical protein